MKKNAQQNKTNEQTHTNKHTNTQNNTPHLIKQKNHVCLPRLRLPRLSYPVPHSGWSELRRMYLVPPARPRWTNAGRHPSHDKLQFGNDFRRLITKEGLSCSGGRRRGLLCFYPLLSPPQEKPAPPLNPVPPCIPPFCRTGAGASSTECN